jgi:hypothetical protein
VRRGHARIIIQQATLPMSLADFDAAEDLFADIIAHTFARENPQLFGLSRPQAEHIEIAGPAAAPAGVGVAPAPNAAGSAHWSVEQGADEPPHP